MLFVAVGIGIGTACIFLTIVEAIPEVRRRRRPGVKEQDLAE